MDTLKISKLATLYVTAAGTDQLGQTFRLIGENVGGKINWNPIPAKIQEVNDSIGNRGGTNFVQGTFNSGGGFIRLYVTANRDANGRWAVQKVGINPDETGSLVRDQRMNPTIKSLIGQANRTIGAQVQNALRSQSAIDNEATSYDSYIDLVNGYPNIEV